MEQIKQQILELELKLLKPEIRTSPKEIDKLLAEGFFEFGSSGNVWYKKDCIVPEGIGVMEMTLSEFDLHPLSDDTVLATYRVRDDTRMQNSLRSSIWKFIDGRWQMFFHQGTITKS